MQHSVPQSDRLEANALGFKQVIFQSIGHMSPAVGVILALGVGVSFAGPALPLSLVLALVACLLIANSVAQLAKHFTSAGGNYTFITETLGPRLGMVIGGCLLLCEIFTPLSGGLAMAVVVKPELDHVVNVPWWVFVVLTVAIYWYLNHRGIKLSINVTVALAIFEMVAIVALALWMIARAGTANTFAVLNPSNALQGGWSGVFKGVIFSVLAFGGFEAAAPLGEEARNPRKTIPRAVISSCLIVGAVYIVCGYGLVMGWGFHHLNTYASDPQPWITLGKHYWGLGFLVIFFALVNSGIAGGSTATTYASRVLLAMGRSGVLPRRLALIHPEHKTPHVAVAVEALISIIGGLILGALWGYGNGLGVAYTTMGASLVIGYIGLCLGTIRHYSTRARREFNPFFHALLPALGIAILVVTLYYQVHPMPTAPLQWGLWFVIIWVIAFVVAIPILQRTRPEAFRRGSDVFVTTDDAISPVAMDTPAAQPLADA
jgi:amino acid transporter